MKRRALRSCLSTFRAGLLHREYLTGQWIVSFGSVNHFADALSRGIKDHAVVNRPQNIKIILQIPQSDR